jgi:blue copper oxidase
VTTERVRLRLLNASGARVYNIGFADDREFGLIATDGALLEAPRAMDRIQLSAGERAEIVAEFEPGEKVSLRSFEPDLGTNFWDGRFAGGDDSFDLLEIRAAGELAPARGFPSGSLPRSRLPKARPRRSAVSSSLDRGRSTGARWS